MPSIIAAPVQIQQIEMILCANAYYSMREKGGDLILRLEEKARPEFRRAGTECGSDWVALVVQNTGHRREKEILQRIFTPFFTTKEPGEGAGMGLSGYLMRSEGPFPAGSKHILVVDDEKEIRETCRMMLTHLGYNVTTTGNHLGCAEFDRTGAATGRPGDHRSDHAENDRP